MNLSESYLSMLQLGYIAKIFQALSINMFLSSILFQTAKAKNISRNDGSCHAAYPC